MLRRLVRLPRTASLFLLLVLFLTIVPSIQDHHVAALQQQLELSPAPRLDGQPGLTAADAVTAAAGSDWVDTASRASVVSFYGSAYAATSPSAGWTGDIGSCRAGSTSSAMKAAELNQINYYRSMAGVPTASGMSSTSNAKNQKAVLIFSADQALSHHPAPDSRCYSADGAEAAANSNICLGCYGVEAINKGYMLEPGDYNAMVGHRRWLLYPQTRSFGSGDIPAGNASGALPSNAIWVIDEHVSDPRPATRDGFVAWPPRGYVPYQVVFPRWSFSLPGADFQNARVSLRHGGTSVSVTIDSRSPANEGYAEDTIVWRPNDLDDRAIWSKPAADSRYTVTVSNVLINGTARSYTYDVIVIDPASAGTPICANSPSTGLVRSHVTIACAGFAPNESVTLHWSTTSSASLATGRADRDGGVSILYRVPLAVRDRHTVVVLGKSSGLIGKKSFFVVPSVNLSPSSGESGATVDVALRGFQAGETISVRFYTSATRYRTVRSSVTASITGTASFSFTAPSAATGAHRVVAAGSGGSSAAATYRTVSTIRSAAVKTTTRTPTPTRQASPTALPTSTRASGTSATPTEDASPAPANTATPEPPVATETPVLPPTETPAPEPTSTVEPTATADPTATAEPTATVEPEAEPAATLEPAAADVPDEVAAP